MKSFKAFLIENTDIREEYKKVIFEFFSNPKNKQTVKELSEDHRNYCTKPELRKYADKVHISRPIKNLIETLEDVLLKYNKNLNYMNTVNGLIVFADTLRSEGLFSKTALTNLLNEKEGILWDEDFKKAFVKTYKDEDGEIKIKTNNGKNVLITPWAGSGNYDKVIWSLDKQIALSENEDNVTIEELLPFPSHLIALE